MKAPETRVRSRKRPSRLALALADAFSTLDEWSEVKVVRDELGHRDRVVRLSRPSSGQHPYDWSAAA